MHSSGVNSHSFLRGDVWTVLEVVVLPLLLSFEVETSESAQVLLTDCLVDSGSPTDSLSVVVSCVGPPVCLGLDIAEDHVLNGNGETWDLWGGMVCVRT